MGFATLYPSYDDCGHQGQRNEPARLLDVLSVVAQLRGTSEAHIAEATTVNAEHLFRFGQ